MAISTSFKEDYPDFKKDFPDFDSFYKCLTNYTDDKILVKCVREFNRMETKQ